MTLLTILTIRQRPIIWNTLLTDGLAAQVYGRWERLDATKGYNEPSWVGVRQGRCAPSGLALHLGTTTRRGAYPPKGSRSRPVRYISPGVYGGWLAMLQVPYGDVNPALLSNNGQYRERVHDHTQKPEIQRRGQHCQ